MTCVMAVARLDDTPGWVSAVLGPRERERAAALVLPAAAAGTALARAVVRLLASGALGLPPDRVEVVARCPRCDGDHGPPSVAGLPWRWSVAHGGELVLVAAALDGTPVGVDVERHGTAVPADVAAGHADPLRQWVQVEAVLKLTGDGLTADPAAVRLRRGRVVGYPGGLPSGVRVRAVEAAADHVAALATVGLAELRVAHAGAALAASDPDDAAELLAAALGVLR